MSKKVEFVSYSGKFPCLCMGELTVKIGGEEVKFGSDTSFWTTGGLVTFDEDWMETVDHGEWLLNESALPEEYKPYAQDLIDCFNENVPYGCCGGCV